MNKKTQKGLYNYVTTGIQLAVTILLFVVGGQKLDEHYNKSPLFLIIGAFSGMIIGFYLMMKDLLEEKKIDNEPNNRKKKDKWM